MTLRKKDAIAGQMITSENAKKATRIAPAQAAQMIEVLSGAFDDVVASGSIGVLAEREAQLQCAFGWWMWINRSTKLTMLAIDQGLGHEATPNVRTVLEHTMMLLWLIDEGDDVLDAVDAAWSVSRSKLYDKLVEANWSIPAGTSKGELVKHPLRGIATNFADLCKRYGAPTIYVPYKLLSAHVHPSSAGARSFLGEGGELLDHPVRPSDEEHRALLALCLHWTADAINVLLADQPLDRALVQVAQILGTRVERPRPANSSQ